MNKRELEQKRVGTGGSRMEKDFVLNSRNLFYKKGYFKTKISEIAEKSGSSVGSFYRFFNSKEDVLIAAIKQELEVFRREVRLLNAIDFDLKWKIKQLCRIILSLLKENPDFFVLIYDIEGRREKISSKTCKWVDVLWKDSKSVFINGINEATGSQVDFNLVERLFENQLKIYLKYLLTDQQGGLSSERIISMNLEEEIKKLAGMIISSCESLNVIGTCNKYDSLTKAYTAAYMKKEVKNILLKEQPFSISFMVFKWPKEEERTVTLFIRESVLRAFIYLIREKFRDEDMVGRLCQDKFILVVPSSLKGGPVDFSERIKEIIVGLNERFPMFNESYFQYSTANILKPSEFDLKMKNLPNNTMKLGSRVTNEDDLRIEKS